MKKYVPHLGHFSIIDACKEPGCPICVIKRRTVTYYLSQVLADYVDAPDLRQELCDSWGYCREHAWSLSEVERGNILTVAIMYQDILEREAGKALSGVRGTKSSGNPITRLLKGRKGSGETFSQTLSSQAECPACKLGREIEENVLSILLKALAKEDADIQDALKSSDGICFPHIECALELGTNQNARDILINIARATLAKIQNELKEFSRKHDYRFQHEPVGDEKYSWKRAINLIVGSK
ncbi:MAG: hypothetical protein GY801_07770 [bacterium]|nr:hypothetical protein [bacterium]